jgi:S1-C subfamily serine protease
MKRISALILFLVIPVFGQQTNPPQPNPPSNEDFEINTVMMESTFKIEAPAAGGNYIATAFIIARPTPGTNPPMGKPVLVTANHVLDEIGTDHAILHIRKKIDEQNNVWVDNPVPIKIRDNSKPVLVNGKSLGTPLWTKNQDADVAVMYVNDISFEKNFKPVSEDVLADDKLLSDADIKPGDELRCLGYPLGIASNDAGFPVLRSGRIASYPIIPTDKTKTFLIDLRVFKGNSGGPVFFSERYRVIPNTLGAYKHFHFLVGLISEEKLFTEISTGPYSQELHQTQLGLAVVVHASAIKKTIEMLPRL